MTAEDCANRRCNCRPPLHNLLICAGPICVRNCPKNLWAEAHGLLTSTHQRYEQDTP